MKNQFSLEINNPCSENLNRFTPIKNRSKRRKYHILSGICLACLMFFSFNTIQAQTSSETTVQEKEFIVKGNVSEENLPLPGVNIVLLGTNIGTETDIDGNFEFPKSLKNGVVLVFSHIGMESQKVVIKNSSSTSTIELKVNMIVSSNNLLGKAAGKKVYKSKKN